MTENIQERPLFVTPPTFRDWLTAWHDSDEITALVSSGPEEAKVDEAESVRIYNAYETDIWSILAEYAPSNGFGSVPQAVDGHYFDIQTPVDFKFAAVKLACCVVATEIINQAEDDLSEMIERLFARELRRSQGLE